jgi:conjugative transfer region protein TrbK
MRGRLLNVGAIGRATGFALVGLAIIATAVHFRHSDAPHATLSAPSHISDPLARELTRCQAIGMAAKDDATCEAAWAENRRRFFVYRPPASAAAPPPFEHTAAPSSKAP